LHSNKRLEATNGADEGRDGEGKVKKEEDKVDDWIRGLR